MSFWRLHCIILKGKTAIWIEWQFNLSEPHQNASCSSLSVRRLVWLLQCRRKPKWGPQTTTIGPHVLPEEQPSYRFRRLLLLQFSSAWALYVALSSLIFPLHQPIRPFTNNKALLGPPLHRDRAPFPRPLVGVFGVVCAGSGLVISSDQFTYLCIVMIEKCIICIVDTDWLNTLQLLWISAYSEIVVLLLVSASSYSL